MGDEALWQHLVVMEDARKEGNAAALAALGRELAAGLGVSEAGGDERGLWCRFEVAGDDGVVASARMRWCWPGRFVMGSPGDEPGRVEGEVQHEVVLTRGLWLGEVPVTQALWLAVMGDNPSRFRSADRPVEGVSWRDGRRLCAALGERLPRLGLRLPSEAEWEYAARAGTSAGRYGTLGEIAWHVRNSSQGFELPGSVRGTHPVARKLPNAWGLYDMLGNVLEWCADRVEHGPYDAREQRDPLGAKGVFRVLRGGSWATDVRCARAACRFVAEPGSRDSSYGLRLAGGMGWSDA